MNTPALTILEARKTASGIGGALGAVGGFIKNHPEPTMNLATGVLGAGAALAPLVVTSADARMAHRDQQKAPGGVMAPMASN